MVAKILVVDDSPTLRRVVTSILEAHRYEVLVAQDGRDAIEVLEHNQVDLVLLDFVMPRMNGFQFCREIRSRDDLKDSAVVLMSAKGDKIRGQFVRQTGALDSITKPFDARGLLVVVEGALKKKLEGKTRPSQILDEESLYEAPSGEFTAAESIRSSLFSAGDFYHALTETMFPILVAHVGSGKLNPKALKSALMQALDLKALGELLARSGMDTSGKGQVLAGDLTVVSVAEILQLIALQRKTGALKVSTSKQEVVVFITQGNVDFTRGYGLSSEFLLGRYLIEDGVLSREELAQVLERPREALLGEVLVEQGYAEPSQVQRALERQTSELVYEVVRWTAGRFVFQVGVEDKVAEKTRLGIPSGGLIMEGFRRVDEWRVIEGSFDFDQVLYRDPAGLDQLKAGSSLTTMEQRVLDAIDGESMVREIVSKMGGSSFEVCKILYQFLNSRLVRSKAF